MGEKGFVKDLGSLALDYCYLKEEQLLRARGDRHRFRFLAVPKALIGCGLSADAVLLYSFMLERLQYSVDNGWQDEKGRVYIVYTAKEIKKNLNCQSQKCADLVKKLEEAGLIEAMRREKGKANYYFVKVIQDENQSGCFENQTGGTLNFKQEDVRKSNTIENNSTDTLLNISKNSNPILDDHTLDDSEKDLSGARFVPTTFENGKVGFRIEYDDVEPNSDEAQSLVQEVLLDFANKRGWMGKDIIRINQIEISREEVQERLCQLTPEMIEYATACIRNQSSELINPRSYALTALYNAPDTYPLYQSMLLKHDKDGEWYQELRAKTCSFSQRTRELKQIGVA